MAVNRVSLWESKLFDLISQAENDKFEWGVCDCLHFAARTNTAISGVDHVEKLALPEYSTRTQAIKILAEHYNGDLLFMIDQILDRSNGKLPRGCIVATMTEDGPALGIWVSPVAKFMSEDGLIDVRRKDLLCAWEC